MKYELPDTGIEKLSLLFGKTRHAYYDHLWRLRNDTLKDELILQSAEQIRRSLPRVGTRKLHHMLNEKLSEHNIKVGRDYLFSLLASHKLLIRNRRRKVVTTNSRHWMRKYTNLVAQLEVTRPEQLWVSDITYLPILNGFIYLSLITDAYSRKIVGYSLRSDLSAEGCLSALQMALSARSVPAQSLIHHSDRGTQYCCKDYVASLRTNKIAISMTNNGDPYENAIAERINGIIKHEFSLFTPRFGFEQTSRLVEESIYAYNHIRPHSSCDYLTPHQAHLQSGTLKKRWKNYHKSILTTHKFEKNDPV